MAIHRWYRAVLPVLPALLLASGLNAGTPPDSAVDAVDAAWADIEKALSELGENLRAATADGDAQKRFEAYSGGLALFADNVRNQVYADPDKPEFLPFLGPAANYCGPGPDISYHLVNLQPGASYRVTGQRGDAQYLDIQQTAGWFGRGEQFNQVKTKNYSSFESHGIKTDSQGNFSFVLSPKKTAEQWWPLAEGVDVLLVRQVFSDYASQKQAATLHFERIDKSAAAPSTDAAAQYQHRLKWLANSLRGYSFCFNYYKKYAELGFNTFDEESFGELGGQGNQAYYQMRFKLEPEQALVVEWQVPEGCGYWGASVYNDQYQVLDFGRRQVSLNPGSATLDKNGVFRFVLSDRDPGIRNWLDASGYRSGMLLLRAKECSDSAFPVVLGTPRLEDLDAMLPKDVDRVTEQERQKALQQRRAHYHSRYAR